MKSFKRLHCESGFSMSIQADERKYCSPRSNTGPWASVEIGFPSHEEPLLMPFAEDQSNPTETVYGWVDVGIVQGVIIKHGGITEGEHPAFLMNAHQSAILAEILMEIKGESR